MNSSGGNAENNSGNWWSTVKPFRNSAGKKRPDAKMLQIILDESQDAELVELVNRFLDNFIPEKMYMGIQSLNPKMYMMRFTFDGIGTASTLIYFDPFTFTNMEELQFKTMLRRIVNFAENS
jgi:hypothetical protein